MPSFASRLRLITQLLMPCDPTTTTGFMLVVRCCIRHWPQCRIPQSRKLPGIPQKPRYGAPPLHSRTPPAPNKPPADDFMADIVTSLLSCH
ncbi:hypothetical protein IWX46DRAFT_601934 [Phyllosticta citricarpa]|uniref:Secreted protein n=1 Tax=Phyllosticta citricarpa TaxID=55181 RepID=A0ABR1MBJ9_9PEZI